MKKGEWLSPIYKNLLWRLDLVVKEPPIEKLDADTIWSESLGRGKIFEKQGNTLRRLQEALKDHCRLVEKQHESGKITLEKKVFTDVIVCLNPEIYHDALIEPEQAHLNAFLHNLMVNHQKDFKSSLPQDRKPRYLAQPDPSVEKNNITFLFGPSIYIPNPDEESAAELILTLDDQRLRPAEMECWRDRKSHTLPIRFYSGQEFLLLVPAQGQNATSTLGRIAIPGWQAQAVETKLLLRRTDPDRWSLYLGSRPQPLRKVSGATWNFEIPLNDQQILKLDLNTASQPSATPHRYEVGRTIILGVSDSASLYQLALERIVLPASRNLTWTLWLDPRGGLASPSAIGGGRKLAQLSLNKSGLSFIKEDGVSSFLGQQIEKPHKIDLSGGSICLLPAPEGITNCVGLLHLGTFDYYPVSEDFITIGRFDANSFDKAPEIALDQLDQPGSLGPGYPPGATLNQLGLSRRHVQIRVNDNLLEAKPVNEHNILYQLGDDGELIAYRQKSLAPLMLELDHALVVGNFILRFMHKKE